MSLSRQFPAACRNACYKGVFLLLLLALAACTPLRNMTGEEEMLPQLRGAWHLVLGKTRPTPDLAPLEPVRYAGMYPFGINTFLQSETEPDKVEQSLDMIAEAGFRWIRQEFAWEDLEIHREGWYVDLRNNEIRNAWAKYDRIVTLAEDRDIQIIARLSTPPNWSRATGNTTGAKAPPDDVTTYGDYVEAVVRRYQGRVRFFQIWNEPNCCEEWGTTTISPEQYVELLKVAYMRAKAVDPTVVILTAPLAPTIDLKTESTTPGVPPAFNDFLFLQRMYDAGAKDYFDVLAVQDYGLWSGPTDHRMRPRVINYSRPEYIRDLMIQNGDGNKAIWASEIGWNSTPDDIFAQYGRASEEVRGTYLVEAFERQQHEWPWMGVTTVWFFKRSDDSEANQAQFYFQLVRPDFTPLPAWDAMSLYMHNLDPVLHRGYHQEDHWVLRQGSGTDTHWQLTPNPDAVFEQVAQGQPNDTLSFGVVGHSLSLVVVPTEGVLTVTVGNTTHTLTLRDGQVLENDRVISQTATDVGKSVLHIPLGTLSADPTAVLLTVTEGTVALDGVIVE